MAAKGLMEKVTIARSRVAADKGCTLSLTRYGNVMASRGSAGGGAARTVR